MEPLKKGNKPIAKDTWKSRLIERIVWTLMCALLAKYGLVVTDGFVKANETAVVETVRADIATEEKYQALNSFGAYIAGRLKREKELEPIIIRCLASHAADSARPPAEAYPEEGVYQP
jgi:hypothetical protein